MRTFLENIRSRKILRVRHVAIVILFAFACSAFSNIAFADEEEKRRIDISLSIFPRIVAVDNDFRLKLGESNNVNLVFVYHEGEKFARNLSRLLVSKNKNIGGMEIQASALSLDELLDDKIDHQLTAIFITERLSDVDMERVLAFAERRSRIVFSPFAGDVERGATVGISVTNRVKPYFNMATLKRTSVDINALLMKMSKRYE